MRSSRVVWNRRQFFVAMAGSAALLGTSSLTRPLSAAELGKSEPFSFDTLTAAMKDKAAAAYAPDATALPDFLATLDYDSYRTIQPRAEKAVALGTGEGYFLQPFHMGWLFKEPVRLFEVADGAEQPVVFAGADFEYRDPALAKATEAVEMPGVAGFRVICPFNEAGKRDELIAFLGASYFRALGRGNTYGLSARGVAIDTWLSGPEEFPRFSSFYVKRGDFGKPLTVYATLEGPSLTGAYRFVIDPASGSHADTTVEVTARLFIREDITEIGIAPLTSMFLFSDVNRSAFDDYRPQVHDSDGLFIETAGGEQIWRALNNTGTLGNSYLGQKSPKRFGLMQRARAFAQFEDAGARYDLRPSVLIEPIGDWGEGAIRLIEAPAKLEADDNIVAFWVPKAPLKAGESAEFSYRLRWGALTPPADGPVAYVYDTRSGQGGVSGVENKATLRKFVVDFKGGPLADPNVDPAGLDAVATASGAKVAYTAVSKLPDEDLYRLAIDLEIDTKDPVELRAYLVGNGRQLTETWLFQWRAA